MTMDVDKNFADAVKPLWDELPLEEKKLLVEALSEEITKNLVPLRSWNINRLIHHAQRQADIAANQLASTISEDEQQKNREFLESMKDFYLSSVFMDSMQSLPVSWLSKNSAGIGIAAIMAYSAFFAEPVLMAKIGLVVGSIVAICDGFIAVAYRRFMQTTGCVNALFKLICRRTTILASLMTAQVFASVWLLSVYPQ